MRGWPQRFPSVRAPVGEEHQPYAPRRQLASRVADDTHADDGHVELVALHPGHPADGPLGHAPLAYEAVHTRDDLGTVRQRHGSRIERLEVAQAQVHGGQSTSS